MDEPRDYHAMWSQSLRERQILYDVVYMWNVKYDTNEHIYETNRLTERTRLWLLRVKKGGGGMDWELGISRWKLLYIRMEKQQGLITACRSYT